MLHKAYFCACLGTDLTALICKVLTTVCAVLLSSTVLALDTLIHKALATLSYDLLSSDILATLLRDVLAAFSFTLFSSIVLSLLVCSSMESFFKRAVR